MQAYTAYKQAQNLPATRIDLILAVYRKALDQLREARAALADRRPEDALPHLTKTQLIVVAMASGLPAYQDQTAVNFLRLYEFIAHQMVLGTLESVDAATKVLTTLFKGFESVREQAVSLERQGRIPPLDRDCMVSLTA